MCVGGGGAGSELVLQLRDQQVATGRGQERA